jgi:methionyl aminopeptidase
MNVRMPIRKKTPLYKTESERDALRAAGRFNAELMDFVRPHVVAGTTTNQINRLVHEYTLEHGHTPACLGYHGFPKSCCTSINQVVCHGIPDNTELVNGDIVNVDLTSIVDGWYGDQSETFLIGEVSEAARSLVQVTFDSLWIGIESTRPGGTVYDIGDAIFNYATQFGLSVVEQYQGHGIGREFHQEPGVPHFPHPKSRWDVIKPGTCFTIEPMLNIGTRDTVLDRRDGWTVRTRDGKLSAQFEHTILMTEDGPEILTLTKNGPRKGYRF